jgi:protein tyrosine/serine phosphatase
MHESRPPGRRARRALAGILILVLAVLFWNEHARHDLAPKRFHEVVPGEIYRSGELTPAAFRTVVRRHDIRTIVDLGAWEPASPGDRLAQAVADELGVDRVVFDLEGDATGDPNAYAQTLRILTDPDRRPVLVHCGAGTERTGCAVYLYRTIVQDVPDDEAYREALRAGHSDRRNPRLRQVIDTWARPVEDAFTRGGRVPWTGPESADAQE